MGRMGDPGFLAGYDAGSAPAYFVLDAESVPDGRLLGSVKYPRETMTPEEAATAIVAALI